MLVVDDEALIVEALALMLEEEGFCAVAKTCFSQALSAIDGEVSFQALVTDIDLGANGDGFMLSRHARARSPDIIVIYATGGAAHRADADGVSGAYLLQKPFPLARLSGALKAALCDRGACVEERCVPW